MVVVRLHVGAGGVRGARLHLLLRQQLPAPARGGGAGSGVSPPGLHGVRRHPHGTACPSCSDSGCRPPLTRKGTGERSACELAAARTCPVYQAPRRPCSLLAAAAPRPRASRRSISTLLQGTPDGKHKPRRLERNSVLPALVTCPASAPAAGKQSSCDCAPYTSTVANPAACRCHHDPISLVSTAAPNTPEPPCPRCTWPSCKSTPCNHARPRPCGTQKPKAHCPCP